MNKNLFEHNTFFDVDKAFDYYNGVLSKTRIKELFRTKEIPCRKIGNTNVTTKRFLDAYIENYEAKLKARDEKLNALVEKFKVKKS